MKSEGKGISSEMAPMSLKIQKIPESSTHSIDKGFGQKPQFLAKERIIPSQDLVHDDVAFGFKPAYSPGDAHTQRKGIAGSQFRSQRQDSGGFKSGFAEFGWLDGKTGTLLSRLRSNARLKINNIKVPAAGNHDPILFSLEYDQNSAFTS